MIKLMDYQYQELVDIVLKEFTTAKKTFSKYDVTTRIREMVGRQILIEHNEVKRFIEGVIKNYPNYSARDNGRNWEYFYVEPKVLKTVFINFNKPEVANAVSQLDKFKKLISNLQIQKGRLNVNKSALQIPKFILKQVEEIWVNNFVVGKVDEIKDKRGDVRIGRAKLFSLKLPKEVKSVDFYIEQVAGRKICIIR